MPITNRSATPLHTVLWQLLLSDIVYIRCSPRPNLKRVERLAAQINDSIVTATRCSWRRRVLEPLLASMAPGECRYEYGQTREPFAARWILALYYTGNINGQSYDKTTWLSWNGCRFEYSSDHIGSLGPDTGECDGLYVHRCLGQTWVH